MPAVSEVAVCSKPDLERLLPAALAAARFRRGTYGLVLVKPNVCGLYHPDLQIIRQVLQYFGPVADRIVVGETESMMYTPRVQFRRLGIEPLAEEFDNVEVMDLTHENVSHVQVQNSHAVTSLPFSGVVRDCDLLVNVPKAGTHTGSRLTCALKNLFGLVAEDAKHGVYHPLGIEKVIADVSQAVRCDLNIADIGEKVLVGRDPLTVDMVACRFVGLDPLEVEHLRLVSAYRGFGLEDTLNRLVTINLS